MRRFLALVATAGAAVALYAATAPAGQQAVTPAQFAALKKQVATLRKDVDALGTVTVNCLAGSAIGVARFNGYVYQGQSGQFITTALDVTDQGDTPSAYFLAASSDQACINFINSGSLRRLASLGTIPNHRAVSLRHARSR